MIAFTDVEVKIVEKDVKSGVVEITNLPPGYGNTMGTALRRILLSSIEGVALTGVKIKGVSHEFASIPGVKDSVYDILLNLKKVKFIMNGGEIAEGKIDLPESGIVTAKDIKLPSNVKVANPDDYIVEVSKLKKGVSIDLTIEKGEGYREVLLKDRNEVGYIPLDADFSPIKRVEVKVEKVRYRDATDFEKLTLIIDTDGSIATRKSLEMAFDCLCGCIDSIKGSIGAKVNKDSEANVEKSWSLADVITNKKYVKALMDAGIDTLEKLVAMNKKEVVEKTGIASRSVSTLEKMLKENGLSLKK